MHYFYRLSQGIAVSSDKQHHLPSAGIELSGSYNEPLFVLTQKRPEANHVSCLLHELSHRDLQESPQFLCRDPFSEAIDESVPEWLTNCIKNKRAYMVNTSHPRWRERLACSPGFGSRIHLAGLGDVGSTLLMGLRILGCDVVDQIGIFDRSGQKIQRWIHEANQIASLSYQSFPVVKELHEDQLFDCDVFVFCIARQVPGLEEKNVDVRMAQFKANSVIIREYARKARDSGFKGLFAVVSDPVDQLCRVAYEESNLDENGIFDHQGLFPEQVKGYGLGVMNARAHFYAGQKAATRHFSEEGRVYGPHGKGLIVANSMNNYQEALSDQLTQLTLNANLAVRSLGFKPYVAPALSSGCFSLLATMTGGWHYSTIFLGGVYMGCLNRLHRYGEEWETAVFPPDLYARICKTYAGLENLP